MNPPVQENHSKDCTKSQEATRRLVDLARADSRNSLWVSSTLAKEAGLRKLKQAYRFYCLLRHFDAHRAGHLDLGDVVELLEAQGWSRSQAYRTLDKGEGIFWNRITYHTDSRRRPGLRYKQPGTLLRLVGAARVAEAWGLLLIARSLTQVPLYLCLPPKCRVGKDRGVATWNAVLLDVQLSTARLTVTKRGRLRHVAMHPYSRAAIQASTGVQRRSQQRYNKLRDASGHLVVKRAANYASTRVDASYCRESVEVESKARMALVHRRLGNSYTLLLERRGWGIAKAYNRRFQAERRVLRAQGLSETSGRRFYNTEKALGKAVLGGAALLPDARYLVPIRDRHTKPVREWATLEGLVR